MTQSDKNKQMLTEFNMFITNQKNIDRYSTKQQPLTEKVSSTSFR